MKCEEVRDEMIAYLKGELDDERKKEIEEHLARCQGCQRELEVAQRVLHQVQSANEESVIDLAEDIVRKAIESGASDIHIDSTHSGSDIRFRIDGLLHLIKQTTVAGREALVARLKMMAGLPMTEKKPQDGRFEFEVKDKKYDVLMSTMPYVLGETVVMKILDRSVPLVGLDKLGFSDEQLAVVQKLSHRPCGMVICTGPTGSGKTTVLYSMIMELRSPEISIVSVEDPVEYLLHGVQQAHVNVREGLTFATILRSFMRQDPDVLMVGEIRDADTMMVAASAATTGHLVLTQMHAAEACAVPQRIVACVPATSFLGSNLIGVIGCRLARAVCKDCREEYTPDTEALNLLGLMAGEMKFYRGKGCPTCRETGFKGRVQLHEILLIDPALAKMITAGQTDPEEVRKHADAHGFQSMIDDGRRRVLQGDTTPEEVYRILYSG